MFARSNTPPRVPCVVSAEPDPAVFRMTPILGILIGIVGVLVLSAIVIVVAIRMCNGAKRKVRLEDVVKMMWRRS